MSARRAHNTHHENCDVWAEMKRGRQCRLDSRGSLAWLPCSAIMDSAHFADGFVLSDAGGNRRLRSKATTWSQLDPPYLVFAPPVGPALAELQVLQCEDGERSFSLKTEAQTPLLLQRSRCQRYCQPQNLGQRLASLRESNSICVWMPAQSPGESGLISVEITMSFRHEIRGRQKYVSSGLPLAQLNLKISAGTSEMAGHKFLMCAAFMLFKELELDLSDQTRWLNAGAVLTNAESGNAGT